MLTRRNKHDRVAFAVHAYMLADDYKVTGVGAAAEDPQGEHGVRADLACILHCTALSYTQQTDKVDVAV